MTINIGYKGKIVIRCKIGTGVQATVYDIMESNQTNGLFLSLMNGVTLHVRTLSLAMSGDIFNLELFSGILHITLYPKSSHYHPNITGRFERVLNIAETAQIYNPFYKILFVHSIPGPTVVGFRVTYDPAHGFLRNGTSQMTLDIINVNIAIPRLERAVDFRISPFDGSVIDTSPSQPKTPNIKCQMKSVGVYKGVY
jgi:hypothetical protein